MIKESEETSPIEHVVMCWKPCADWDDLPLGTWLVKIDKDRKPYNVAVVSLSGEGKRRIIVGNYFHWDMGNIVAYTPFEEYETQR